MGTARRTFTNEFKIAAVQLVTGKGCSFAEAARSLDVSENLLRKWKQILDAEGDQAFPGPVSSRATRRGLSAGEDAESGGRDLPGGHPAEDQRPLTPCRSGVVPWQPGTDRRGDHSLPGRHQVGQGKRTRPQQPRLVSHAQGASGGSRRRPDEKNRNPVKALELAKRSTELVPKDGRSWLTLGIAHYRSGDFPVAKAALRKSLDLKPSGDNAATAKLFLAMTLYQLDEKEPARKAFWESEPWIKQDRPDHKYLQRIRNEAMAALELQKQP